MTDFEIGDTVRVVNTFEGEVLEFGNGSVRIQDYGWFDTDEDETTVEVVEKRKPKAGDQMTEALFHRLPHGSLIRRRDSDYLYVAVAGKWVSVKFGDTFTYSSFLPSSYDIHYIPE